MILQCWLVLFIPLIFGQNLVIHEIAPKDIKRLKLEVNASSEIVLLYRDLHELNTINPFSVKTYSDSNAEFPVMVVARQTKAVSAWSVPMILETTTKDDVLFFNQVSKILCHDSMEDIVNSDFPNFSFLRLHVSQMFIISLSTASPTTINVEVALEEQKEFYVELDKKYSVAVSPSEPKYVFFRVDKNVSDTVVIQIDSEDEFCFTVSVQDSRCPVFDMNKDIKYEGIHQTINRKGSLAIDKKKFANGFFLVFVAKPDNFDCSQENSVLPRTMRLVQIQNTNITTIVNFSINNGISYKEYAIAISCTFIVLLITGLILLVLALLFHRYGTISKIRRADIIENEQITPLDKEKVKNLLDMKKPVVSWFARHPLRIRKRSYNYLSHTLNIGLFYSIPVVQLVVTYQRIVNLTGNQDMCYYNFMCAHPALGFSDFNHVFSNIGYIIFGALYIFIVKDRARLIQIRTAEGIPVHYGLFYAMGTALIMEGLLSACYHICPSQSNYQFDTSFMYIMAVLCMIKLYQNRHPDINSTAYTTFSILGAAIFMAMIGILRGSFLIWIIFSLSYTALCVAISFKIYFMNYVLQGLVKFKDNIMENGICSRAFLPIRTGRFILLAITNVANFSMIVIGLSLYSKNFTDFGTFLLYLLLGNTLIHTIFYTTMKLYHKERICFEAGIYGILALITWGCSGYFFLDAATLWTVTPAESRQWNQQCVLLSFYDKHDIWHLLSAPALFFNFMFLMCLDDDIMNKKQSEIPAF